MLRFTLLTCLIAFAATSQVFAQQPPMEDVVYLKNGGVIRGTIVEQIPGESLKIQTRDGNMLVFTMDEVAKLAKEMPKQPVMRGSAGATGGKVEVGTLLALSHFRYRYGDRTKIDIPMALSVWLIPSEYMAIGSEFSLESFNSTIRRMQLGGQAAFFIFSPSSIYLLGAGSLLYGGSSDFGIGIGMGLREPIGSALVLRMEGRYEHWFDAGVNTFSFIIGLGTRLGG